MREVTFALEFDVGIDPVMDAFIAHPELRSEAIGTCVRRDLAWQIERVLGPSDALDRIERHRFGDANQVEEVTLSTDDTPHHHERLERSASKLVVYSFLERLHTSDSGMATAARRLDLGHVLQIQRAENCQEWRILLRSGANIDAFYQDIEGKLVDGITLHLGRCGEVDQWQFDSLATVSLLETERYTLEAGIEYGYFETPREVTVSELADQLDLPQSTVSYRLRRAEAKLVKGYVRRSLE